MRYRPPLTIVNIFNRDGIADSVCCDEVSVSVFIHRNQDP